MIRKAGNELTGIMKKRYDQLVRTKRYRKLKSLYKKYKDADNKKALKDICDQMKEMQKQYGYLMRRGYKSEDILRVMKCPDYLT